MNNILHFFRLVRAANLAVLALALALFYYLILVPAHKFKLFTTLLPFSNTEFVLFVLSVVSVAAAGNVINDYLDFELDRKYKPDRPLPRGAFSLDQALYMHAAFAFSGIGIGFWLAYSAQQTSIGYIYVICVLLLYGYSAFLKKMPLVGNIVVAALTGFVFILLMLFEAAFFKVISFDGAPYVMDMLLWQVKFYGGFAVLTNLAREIVKDIEDYEGDRAFGIRTVAVSFGVPAAKILAAFVLLLLLGGLGFFLNIFWTGQAQAQFYYLLGAVGLPVIIAIVLLLTAVTQRRFAFVSLLLKLIMLTGILSIPLFYWLNQPSAS